MLSRKCESRLKAEIREFSDELWVEAPKLVADRNAKERPGKPLKFVLRVTADPAVMSKFEAALLKVRSH